MIGRCINRGLAADFTGCRNVIDSAATVSARPSARSSATLPAAKSIRHASHAPKMSSPKELVSAGMAITRITAASFPTSIIKRPFLDYLDETRQPAVGLMPVDCTMVDCQ